MNKAVEARRRWKKFGDCAGLPPGPEKVITTVAEEIFFDYPKSTAHISTTWMGLTLVCRQAGRQGRSKGGRTEGCSPVIHRVPQLRQAGPLDAEVPAKRLSRTRWS